MIFSMPLSWKIKIAKFWNSIGVWSLRFVATFREKKNRRYVVTITLAVLFILYVYAFIFIPPLQFPVGTIVSIPKGATLSETALKFKKQKIVRSDFWFRTLVILANGERSVVAGDYFLSHPTNVMTLVRMVTSGDFGLTPIKTTIPEGSSIVDIAVILGENFPSFNAEYFLRITKGKEGYLFPDTYYFLPNEDEENMVKVFENTFKKKISSLERGIELSGKDLSDIVIMASIIEREAHTSKSRRIISGILWKRLSIGMPLQVDVTFDYINGKNTFELTSEDLESDSPYNTYRYTGLPPGPIGNPSLDALEAAIFPIESNYLYFLADKNGEVYYSATFKEHKRKKAKYLN